MLHKRLRKKLKFHIVIIIISDKKVEKLYFTAL